MIISRQKTLLLTLGVMALSGCVQVPPWEAMNRLDSGNSLAAQKPRRHPQDPNSSAANDNFPFTAISAKVATVVSPETDPRPVSLAECLALALENGRTGEFFDAAGSDRRTSVTGSGRASAAADVSDSIRVFAY